MHTTTRIAAVAAVAGLAALGLSACSSSPAPAADTASAIATVAPTALRSADTLSICTTNLGSPPNITTDESETSSAARSTWPRPSRVVWVSPPTS